MDYSEIKSSGITQKTPENILLGAGTIHKGLKMTDVYVPLTAEPEDWDTNYANYFTKSGEDYIAVTGDTGSAPAFETDKYYKKRKGWNFKESLIGATSGGTTCNITPEITDIEVDGKLVKVKRLEVKTGETATIETNLIELTPDIIKALIIGTEQDSADFEGYKEIVSRAQLNDGDYLENFGYMGKRIDGRPIIIIFPNARVSGGFSINGQNKTAGVVTATFECVADLSSECDRLPYRIIYPKEETV